MTLPDPDLDGKTACVFDAYGTVFDVFSVANGVRKAVGDRADVVTATSPQTPPEYAWLRRFMKAYADIRQVTRNALAVALSTAGNDDALRGEPLPGLLGVTAR